VSCPVCNKLAVKDLRRLDAALKTGDLPLLGLAQQFGLEVAEIDLHRKSCVEDEVVDGFGHLANMVRRLSNLSETVEEQITNPPVRMTAGSGDDSGNPYDEDKPRGPAITDLVAILRETRETIVALRRLQSVDDAVVGLTRNVVGPLVASATTICVEELRRLREAMFPLVQHQYQPRVKESVDTALERIAARLKAESMHDLREKVEAVLQSKPVGGKQSQ
jgi:hypothetical protein